MKQDIARFVEQCSNCQQVKADHQRPEASKDAKAIVNTKVEVG
jgi:hypothetical protein